MILHGGISEFYDRKTINALGLTQEQFFSLPYEYQKTLVLGFMDMMYKAGQNKDSKQLLSKNDSNVKKKVLTILKRIK